jgi:hypothetical protein
VDQKGRALVSQKFKNIVEALGDFPHQFEPVNIYKNGEVWELEQPYYRMKVRRRVVFEPGEWVDGETYVLSPKEKCVYCTLIDPEFKRLVCELPVWQVNNICFEIYVSEAVYSALVDAGITGIKLFSDYYGRQGEGAVRV